VWKKGGRKKTRYGWHVKLFLKPGVKNEKKVYSGGDLKLESVPVREDGKSQSRRRNPNGSENGGKEKFGADWR